jgi:hypothetical protein
MNTAQPSVAPRAPAQPASAAAGARAASASTAAFATAALLLLALHFGPLVGLLGFVLDGDPRWALVGLARDVIGVALLAFGAAALFSAHRTPLPASARWALLLVASCLLLGLLAASSPLVLALNLRRLVFLPLLFVAMLLIPWSPAQLRALEGLVLTGCLVVAALGIAEWLAPESLWTHTLQIEAFKSANPFDRFGWMPYHESGRFFSWDFERWVGMPLRRAISSYLEPTTLAAGLSAGLVLALAQRARGIGAGWWAPLLAACALATLAKSFLIFVPLVLAWRLVGVPAPTQVLGISAAAAVLALVAAARGHVEGPLAHVEGLASALRFLADGHWLGEGIGEAGNYSDADTEVGAESGLGNTIAQIGVFALLPLLWVRALAREVMQRARAQGDPGGPWLAAWLLFWLVAYLFSASSLGVGGNALGFVLLALYLHRNRPHWALMAWQR